MMEMYPAGHSWGVWSRKAESRRERQAVRWHFCWFSASEITQTPGAQGAPTRTSVGESGLCALKALQEGGQQGWKGVRTEGESWGGADTQFGKRGQRSLWGSPVRLSKKGLDSVWSQMDPEFRRFQVHGAGVVVKADVVAVRFRKKALNLGKITVRATTGIGVGLKTPASPQHLFLL